MAKGLALLLCWSLFGQDRPDLAAGRFLVADESLGDPNFAESVVLIVKRDSQGTMGLIVNRRASIPLAKLLRDEAAKSRSDRAFWGGPVARTGLFALVRSAQKPGEAQHVISDVYLVTTAAEFTRALTEKQGPEKFRVYLGYSGWGAGQLEAEMEHGAWHTLRGDADAVFDSEPSSLWPRLVKKTRLRIAQVFR